MKVFIAGGRGRVGSGVADLLGARGVEVVPGGLEDGVDVVSGEGVPEALAGVDVILNVLNTNRFDTEGAVGFFRTTTERLSAEGRQAGVGHHVLLSIVGVGGGDASSEGYYAGKVAQERALVSGGIPFTIVRSTQFHSYVPVLVDQFTQDGRVVGTRALVQPVDLGEVVELLADVVTAGPAGVVEIAGPERYHLDDLLRATLAADGDTRDVVTAENTGRLDALVPRGEYRMGTRRYPIRGIPTAA